MYLSFVKNANVVNSSKMFEDVYAKFADEGEVAITVNDAEGLVPEAMNIYPQEREYYVYIEYILQNVDELADIGINTPTMTTLIVHGDEFDWEFQGLITEVELLSEEDESVIISFEVEDIMNIKRRQQE